MPLSAGQADAAKPKAATTTFTLNAKVLDGGQQVVSLTINAARLGIKAKSLSADTFSVTAKGVVDPALAAAGGPVFGEFATPVNRPVTGVHLDHHGRIVIELKYGNAPDGTGVE